ncbi:MAG: rRNA maturation RNase YbeY [Anaerolineae bacterium]|nr:rRNA maturation RNase YbeY [Gemmatimonadaceae bacterium]
MTIAVDVSSDGVRSPLSQVRVAHIASRTLRSEGIRHAMVSIAFVSNRAIATLNKRHFGHRGATDIISLGFKRHASAAPIVGDIYIAPDIARANARLHGSGVRAEIARLIVHGVLHILGHEHPEGPGRTASDMWLRQERLLAHIPAPAAR